MDELTREELEQLLAVFRDQSLTILEEMGHDLMTLESEGADSEVLSRLRRAAHTVKGDSACIGLDGITELAHVIEDYIDGVVSQEQGFDKVAVDAIFEGLDAMRGAISAERVEDIEEDRLRDLVERLSLEDTQASRNHGGECHEGETALEAITFDREAKSGEGDGPQQVAKDGGRKRNTSYVRVEASRVDALLNLAGEMVIARSLMSQLTAELELALPRNDLVTRFGGASSQLGKLIAELQKSVLKMRMAVMDQVFKRFARPMRELAAERGKQIHLDIQGGDTELDRTLVDLLYEPLLHLLRNAVDHGLESPHDRTRAGKPNQGLITLRAYHEGNQVVVEVRDDGRGIDPEAVRRKAVSSGAITGEEAGEMTDQEALDLIFLPGLSTASEVTLVSGRGIGAAAVKSAIEQLRGSISIESKPGEGTVFLLRLPLTLAIIKAIVFTAGGRMFALPLLAISEIARIQADEVVNLDGFESFRLRDRFVSLVRPGLVLEFERRRGGAGTSLRSEAKKLFVIVLGMGDRRYGVVADSLMGEQELLIKPLDNTLVQNEAMAGAAVLGDGRVVLIMDPGMLFKKALKYERVKGNGAGSYAS